MAELLCYIIIHSPLQCRDHTGIRAARLPAMWVQPQVWFTRDDQREELRSVAWFSLKDEQRSGTDGFSRWLPWEFESACWLRRRRSPRTSCGWLIWLVVVTCFFLKCLPFSSSLIPLRPPSLNPNQRLFYFQSKKNWTYIRCKSCGTFTFYFHQGGYLCRERFSNSELTPSVVGNNNNLVQMLVWSRRADMADDGKHWVGGMVLCSHCISSFALPCPPEILKTTVKVLFKRKNAKNNFGRTAHRLRKRHHPRSRWMQRMSTPRVGSLVGLSAGLQKNYRTDFHQTRRKDESYLIGIHM